MTEQFTTEITTEITTEFAPGTAPEIASEIAPDISTENDGGPSQDNGFATPAIDDLSAYPVNVPTPELPYEQQMFKLEEAVTRHPLSREIMYHILGFCQEERLLRTIEDEVATWPAFAQCTQNQFHMITTLTKNYGLELIERDAQGNAVTPEQKQDLTEDEIDDLVCTLNYKTTALGTDFYNRHAPRARILELMEARPERAATYREVLEFIGETPRTYNEVCMLLEGRDVLQTVIRGNAETMQPSVFVDKLERSGAVVWNKGWTLTKEGKEYLEELKLKERDW